MLTLLMICESFLPQKFHAIRYAALVSQATEGECDNGDGVSFCTNVCMYVIE